MNGHQATVLEAFMLLSSALVEYAEPARCPVRTRG